MEEKGYKGFFINRKNQKGEEFEAGKVYSVEAGEVFFGERGHGFHFCKHIEDCFNYFNPEYSVYAEVTGLGNVKIKDDTSTDSYGICVSSQIRIERFLTREDILDIYLNSKKHMPIDSIMKFLKMYKLTPKEIEAFLEKYYKEYSIVEVLLRYQLNQEDVYTDKMKTYKQITEIQEKYKVKEKKNDIS